jgi:uncharacterized protein (DUF1015 family)
MRLFAFEGLHYTGGPQEVGRLAAPPYDQIDNAARDRFHARSPHQFVHLTRPLPSGGLDMYRHSADLHGRWLADGTLARDPRPALYPYVIDLAGGGRRLGVVGLAGIDDPRVIRPHEQTLDKPLADRLALLRATHVDLEPILLLSEDGGRLERLLEEDLPDLEPFVDHVDADGHHHRLFRLEDPARIALYTAALNGNPSAIADGHHRYKVAQRFAGETGAPAGTPASTKLAVVTSLASPALTIDPIHRALKDPVDLRRLARFAAERTPFAGGGGAELAAAVAAAPQPAIGVWAAGGQPEIWRLDPSQAPSSLPPGGRELPVLLLHEALFPALGLPAAAATDGTVVYRNDPEALHRMVAAGEAALGIWLPPMQPAAFAAAIAQGDMLPPKSTRFLPKVMSGLIWADHTSRLI